MSFIEIWIDKNLTLYDIYTKEYNDLFVIEVIQVFSRKIGIYPCIIWPCCN